MSRGENMKILRKILMFIIMLSLSLFVLPKTSIHAIDNNQEDMFEFRGAWVATVSNIDIGKQSGTTEAAINSYKNEFLNLLKVFEEYNMNSIIFQIRPINDAFYKSEINPWSRYLIGTEGKDPGWDPMEWMIEESHKRNMEFHAWLNPYRASVAALPVEGDYSNELASYLNTLDDKNFAKNNPDLLIRGVHDKNNNDARILLNPAKEEVRQHIYDTIEEIVRNYKVDAIHFDDYFYNGVANTEDAADYTSYTSTGGSLTKGDWRREQVNILIEGLSGLLDNLNNELDKDVELGISPAGVWAPADNMGCGAYGQPGGMTGISCYSYSSYVDLYADTRKWVQEEWIDYILPQNYGAMGANHEGITSWWANEVKDVDVKLYMGLAPYQYNDFNSAWDTPEMENQMVYGDSFETLDGYAMYNISNIRYASNANMSEALDVLKQRWGSPVFNPIKSPEVVNEYLLPQVSSSRNSNNITLTFDQLETVYGYVLYRTIAGENFDVNTAEIFDIVYNRDESFTVKNTADNLTNYTYYIQPVYKNGHFSTNYKELTTGIYDYNSAPVLKNLKIDTDLLVFDNKRFVTITGEATDANNDDLTVSIQLISPTYTRPAEDFLVINGEFTGNVYLPPVTINRGHYVVTVSDGTDSSTSRTYSFYTPPYMYTDLMQYIMTIEIITNDTVNNIFK